MHCAVSEFYKLFMLHKPLSTAERPTQVNLSHFVLRCPTSRVIGEEVPETAFAPNFRPYKRMKRRAAFSSARRFKSILFFYLR
jgi:hypothetical protein